MLHWLISYKDTHEWTTIQVVINYMMYVLQLNNYLPRLATLWSSNEFPDRSSDVSTVFSPTVLHNSHSCSGNSLQNSSVSDVKTLFSVNIVPVLKNKNVTVSRGWLLQLVYSE